MAGQLIERGPRTWLLRVFLGRDASGKRRYLNKTVHGTKKEAQAILNRMLTEKDQGLLREQSRQPLGKYLETWLETVAKQRVRESTFRSYSDIIRLYVPDDLKNMPLSKITPLDVQNAYTKLLVRGLSARIVRYTHSVLHSALSQAVKWGMISANPAAAVELPRQQRAEQQVFTIEEARRFLDACENHRLGTLFLVALTTGLRPSEYTALRWSDLDWKTGVLSVNRTITHRRKKDGGGWVFEDTKRARSRRTVKLQAQVLQALKAHKAAQAAERLKLGTEWHDLGLIFTNKDGTPLTRYQVSHQFKRLCQRLGLPNVRLYDLRHTAATMALVAGVPAKVVSEQLGHASAAFTLDVYSHVLPGMQDEAARRVEALLRGTPKAPRESGAQDAQG